MAFSQDQPRGRHVSTAAAAADQDSAKCWSRLLVHNAAITRISVPLRWTARCRIGSPKKGSPSPSRSAPAGRDDTARPQRWPPAARGAAARHGWLLADRQRSDRPVRRPARRAYATASALEGAEARAREESRAQSLDGEQDVRGRAEPSRVLTGTSGRRGQRGRTRPRRALAPLAEAQNAARRAEPHTTPS